MVGDTVTAIFYGKPKGKGSITNWRYAYAESIVTYGSYLDVIDAQVIIIKAGKVTSGTCKKVWKRKTVTGLNATFNFVPTPSALDTRRGGYRIVGPEYQGLKARAKLWVRQTIRACSQFVWQVHPQEALLCCCPCQAALAHLHPKRSNLRRQHRLEI